MRILTDDDIDRVPLAPLIAAVRKQIVADAGGQAVAPPRHLVPFGKGNLTFTIGGDQSIAGFRAYQTFAGRHGGPDEHQVVAAWDQSTGEMFGLALGNRLGALRTGIIGAVAADTFLARDAKVLTVVGTGRQAETQLLAVSTIRDFAEIRICGRRPEVVVEFAARIANRIGRSVSTYTEPQAALAGADAVILATTATSPVIDPDLLEPHAYVATLGPSTAAGHELPLAVADRARTIATDSPQQIAAMGDRHMLAAHDTHGPIHHLGLFTGSTIPRQGPVLFLSIGLAGTEVACLAAALEALS